MPSRPLVSVVVPVYEGERFLDDALTSALAQDYSPFEVIVVDDGSPDASGEIAKRYVLRCIRQENQGVAAARNAGIEAGGGELIAFLDQDDSWLPGKLSRQVQHLGEHPELGFTMCSMQNFLEPGTPRPGWMKPEWLDGPQDGYIPSALVVRRSAFDEVGLFDTALPDGSDADWLIRAKDAGVAGDILPDVLVRRRVHDRNGSSDLASMRRGLFLALRASIARQRAMAGDGRTR